jgi:hypothetical protein
MIGSEKSTWFRINQFLLIFKSAKFAVAAGGMMVDWNVWCRTSNMIAFLLINGTVSLNWAFGWYQGTYPDPVLPTHQKN